MLDTTQDHGYSLFLGNVRKCNIAYSVEHVDFVLSFFLSGQGSLLTCMLLVGLCGDINNYFLEHFQNI